MDPGESSWLLLLLSALVTGLMALVAFNTLRRLRVSERTLLRWRGLAVWSVPAVVGVVLGTGLSAAPVLALGAEGLNFPIGYGLHWAPLLWLGGCLAATVLAALPAWSRRGPVLWLAGVLFGLLALALKCGWIVAAGFGPGVLWRGSFVGAAALLLALVGGAAFWLSLSTTRSGSDRPHAWQLAAAGLLVLGMAVAQEILVIGTGLSTQLGSVYARQVPGTLLCVAGGAGVPMVYAFMLLRQALWLWQRRSSRHRQTDRMPNAQRDLRSQHRPRKRHRIPTL